MAQALAVNQIIKLQLWTNDTEQTSVNTFHYFVAVITGTAPDLDDFLAAAIAELVSSYKAFLTANANYAGATAQIVAPLPLMVGVADNTGHGLGDIAGPGMARQATGLISWKTPFAGPGGRGRTYLPFLPASALEGIGVPTAAFQTLMGTFAQDVADFTNVSGGTGSATIKLVIKSKNSADSRIVTEFHVAPKFATQKRRGSYGRPNTSPFG